MNSVEANENRLGGIVAETGRCRRPAPGDHRPGDTARPLFGETSAALIAIQQQLPPPLLGTDLPPVKAGPFRGSLPDLSQGAAPFQDQ